MQKKTIKAAIATNRFGLGAAPGELETAAQGEREWLLQQMTPLLFSTSRPDAALALQLIKDSKALAKKKQSEKNDQTKTEIKKSSEFGEMLKPNYVRNTTVADTVQHGVSAENSLSWRLLDFFSNHFSVSAQGRPMSYLAPTLERDAIAPHLYGQFEDLLVAVSTHPAMLVYLNNEQSIGPNSPEGKRRKNRGLNENLAREILELHTLGVKGGYTQDDVIELAKAITGWSVIKPGKDRDKSKSGFIFRANNHEPGTRSLLGKKYPPQGLEQGTAILRDLAKHPATASFLSYKLARHFVADVPPPSLVETLRKTWLKTGGNIRAVVSAMITDDASWHEQAQKYKTPREFFISAARATKPDGITDRYVVYSLRELGQSPFSAGSPAGFSDISAGWDGADALYARLQWSSQFAKRLRVEDAVAVADSALGDSVSNATRTAIRRAESRTQALAILLMSPEFLRR